jgi:hypothetical protein
MLWTFSTWSIQFPITSKSPKKANPKIKSYTLIDELNPDKLRRLFARSM